MSELDKGIERLKSEGHSSKEIQKAMSELTKNTMKQPLGTGSLDEYLDKITVEQGNELV
jgi:hypothetical protein